MGRKLDAFEDSCVRAFTWPLEASKGKHWSLKLLALTVGWLWMLPLYFAFLIVFLIVIMPVAIWESLEE